MHCRIYAHRYFIRIFAGNLFVHVKQVTVFLFHHIFTHCDDLFFSNIIATLFACFYFSVTFYSCSEIQEYCLFGRTYTITCITSFLSRTAGHISWYKVTKCWVSSF